MLDLILITILKYTSLLIVARLFCTAFGFEFGISRQYLRFLEFLFHLGEKRIEKVESRSLSFASAISEANEDGHGHGHGRALGQIDQNESKQTQENNNNEENCCESESETNGSDSDSKKHKQSFHIGPAKLSNGFAHHPADHNPQFGARLVTRPSKLDLIEENSNHQTLTEINGDDTNRSLANRNRKCFAPRPKRISTPDGPPVFLLDDSDLECQAEEESSGLDLNFDIYKQNQDFKKGFHLHDVSKFVQKGIAAIVDDEVTKRFTHEELKTWNLLTRTETKNYQFMSKSLGFAWLLGVLFRYICLLPLRIMFTLAGNLWLVVAISIACMLPKKFNIRDNCYYLNSLMAFRMLSCGITSKLQFHNTQFRPQKGDICVANHTTPNDVLLLNCDNCYAVVGQRHGGLLGMIEGLLSRATKNVWFDRYEMKDRFLVTERLREHIKYRDNWPILIFPEGTCINNSAVMLFKKGSFEVSDRIFPIAMKYDIRFGDAFWDSSKYSYLQYYFMLMSSWAIKCDVWYLPPMDRLHGESAAEFAGRVKAAIARQAGLKDLNWDGQLKRQATKEIWKEQQQEDFAKRLNVNL